jgi:DNA-binding response OmpR family regulator
MNEKILVIDDDKEIVKLISIYLVNEGYQVVKAFNGVEALKIIEDEKPKLIILDVMMPGIDGIEVCKKIRERWSIPIVILSAKVQKNDRITGLLTGADDYITKPFDALEFIVRIKALIRRTYIFDNEYLNNKQHEDIIKLNQIIIKKASHSVFINNEPITLTAREFEILLLLASNPGRIFSAEEIFERVWKEKYFQSNNTVMVHISNLRDKIESHLEGEKIIHTVWGVGYKIEKK